MNTYIKYFIHYLLVTAVINTLITVIIKSNNIEVDKYVLLTYIGSIILFCAGMSWFINKYSAKDITIYKEFTNEQELRNFFDELDEFIRTKTNREIRNEVSKSYYIYKPRNRYLSWLINQIEVQVKEDVIRIVIPQEYRRSLSKI